MSAYTIHVVRTEDPKAEQKFHVRIVAANGEIVFTSEQYENRIHAVSIGEEFAGMIDANLIDAT